MPRDIQLDKLADEPRGTAHVVGGVKPYLWIGDTQGRYLASVSDGRLRTLRDEITRALSVRERADNSGLRVS